MNVLITGTSGYLGSRLSNFARSIGHSVVEINRNNIKTSITYEEYYRLKGVTGDLLIHCAGKVHSDSEDYSLYHEANVQLTEKLAISAIEKKIKRFIYISSLSVLEDISGEVTILSSVIPKNAYTQSKAEAEIRLKELFKKSECELVIFRPPLIVGKNAPGNIELIEKLLSVFSITPFGVIYNKKSIVTIETLCRLLLDIESLSGKEVILPAEQHPFSTSQIFNLVASYHGKKFIHLPIPKIILKSCFFVLNRHRLSKNLLENLEIKNVEIS